MSYVYEKSEQHQSDISVNDSLHKQSDTSVNDSLHNQSDLSVNDSLHKQSDTSVNDSLHKQSLHSESLLAVSPDQDLKYEQQQWDVKPDPYFPLKQELTPGLSLKSELPASSSSLSQPGQQYQDDQTISSTQHKEYPADISMASSKEDNGLYFVFSLYWVLDIEKLFVYLDEETNKKNKAMMHWKSPPTVHMVEKTRRTTLCF